MSASPLISVIVPVYNTEKYLRRCVDSILGQTFTDFELLLVDDGSTDGSGAICDEYAGMDERVRVFHKPNGGLPSARNAGLTMSCGEWIIHVDSDDYIVPAMFNEFMSEAEKECADVVMGGMRLFWEDTNEEKIVLPPVFDDDKTASLDRYMRQDWTCLAGTMSKRSLYTDHGLKSPEGITWCEDFYLMVRLIFFSNKTVSIQEPLYHYCQHSQSMMGKWGYQMIVSAHRVFESTEQFFKSHGFFKAYKEAIGHRMLNIHQKYILDKNHYDILENIASHFRSCILNCPLLSKKRKILYMMHSFGLVRFLGLNKLLRIS